MYKNNKNGKILNILLGIIALFLIVFIIAWVVNKGNNNSNIDSKFKNDIENIQEIAKNYFANNLPNEIGDTTVLTLQDLYDLNLVKRVSYGKTACDGVESYSSITKINNTEYKVKTNLVCGDKNDNITEKISSNTIVNDNNGKEIINDSNGNVELNVDKNVTSSDGKTNDVVNCLGPICRFEEIPTKCTTTYTYEYVKRNVSCPDGYTLKNGVCYKEIVSTAEPKVNKGSSYYVYDTVVVTPGTSTKYCSEGNLAKDGYCYAYENKQTSNSTSCPKGYTQSGNACYKYANLINNSTTNYDCPSGYTKTGTGSNTKCYKTATSIKTYTAWGNPTSTYQTFTKESTYTYELSKKVLVGTGTKAGKTIYTYSTYARKSYYTCAVGDLGSDNRCYVYTDFSKVVNKSSICPDGYTKDGNTCYMKANLINTTSSSCPKGYSDNGSNCVKKSVADTISTYTTYSCRSGYTKTGTGSNTKCYKVVTSSNTKYCENANDKLINNKCTRTTIETANPIWSNSEFIYSKEPSLAGYQKTGVAKFVTKCTPVEEIHYK